MDGTTVFLIGLVGALLGTVIGGYLSYRGGVKVTRQIEQNKINKARIKVINQLDYILRSLQSNDLNVEVSADISLLISVADLVDDESKKIIYFFQTWKDIQFDARRSHLNNSTIAVNLMKQTINPLVDDIEAIIQKYQYLCGIDYEK